MKILRDLIQRQKWLPLQRGRTAAESFTLIQSFYRSAFGRSADPTGLAHYVPRLRAGLPLAIFAQELAESEEFRARFGSSPIIDAKFVNDLYRNALGRFPDSAELAWWLAGGKRGVPRFKVLAALAGSEQVLERFEAPSFDSSKDPGITIKALYQAALGRLPEKGNLATAANELRSNVPLEILADDLVRSAEFQERHGSKESPDAAFITDLFLDGMGRRPDLESLGNWLSEAKKGVTRANLLAAVARSDEATDRLLAEPLDLRARYQGWIAGNDTIAPPDRTAILKHIGELLYQPIISVILPAGRTSGAFLRNSMKSLAAQLYPNWELCIGLDNALVPEVSRIAEEFKILESRLLLAPSRAAGETMTAVNRALAIATGEFVTFLMPGDRLPEQSIYEVGVELNGNPSPDIVYTDSDQINSKDERFNPCFKTGFDPDLLLSYNYVGNLVVYRRALLEKIGWLRSEFQEAAFHDLILRATAKTTPHQITHIPAILYHGLSEVDNIEKQPPARFSGEDCERAVIRDFLDQQGHTDASLLPVSSIPGAFRVVWPLPERELLVSIIVPTRDRADLVSRCVEGVLHRTEYRNLEVLIVDNESSQQTTLDLFNRLSRQENRVRILSQPGEFNYSALNNAASREAHGEVLVLLNNDTDVIHPGWLRELVSQAIRPDVGAVGAKLLYLNETLQHGGIVLGPKGAAVHVHRFAARNDPGYFGQLALARTLSAVTGACLSIRREVYLEVGGMDEVNLPVSFNDVDLCLQVQAHGYRVVWTPFAELFHLESVSRGVDKDDTTKYKRAVAELRHLRNTWAVKTSSGDQFHNPNLQFGWDTLEIPSASRRERPWTIVHVQNLNQE